MQITQDPFVPELEFIFLFDTQYRHMEIVDTFRYLGVPISRTLSSESVTKLACAKIWAAHSAAQRAGMRPHGLAVASRVIAWKAFVWPHVLFYLPFMSHGEASEIQTVVNTSLRSISFWDASPEALSAEFGIPLVDVQWDESVAILGGRLQSPPAPLRAAAIFQALLTRPDSAPPSSLVARYHIALCHLNLRHHWPAIQKSVLPEPARQDDKLLQQNPKPGASPLAPYRHAWSLEVQLSARKNTNTRFSTWMHQTDHRANSYCLESLAALPTVPSRTASAFWISLPLQLHTQQHILQLRVLASPISTHTPSRKRAAPRNKNADPYEESWCPLCARIPVHCKLDEARETLQHLFFECPHLHQEQQEIHNIATAKVALLGGLRLTLTGEQVPWAHLPIQQRLGLLLGNPTTALLHSGLDLAPRKQWLTSFLDDLDSSQRRLLLARTRLITEYYPELLH